MENLDKIIQEAIQKAISERGHINILIAGRSGVGKSTLINSVFQGNFAETGQGKPVTKSTRQFSKDGIPLTIYDTRGLEMAEFQQTIDELEKLVADKCSERDSNLHIHVAWVCIQEDGRRVEDAEIKLHEMLSRHVPILSIVTKARSDNGFKAKVGELLPKAKNVIRVRAIREELDEGQVLEAMGLGTLIEATSELIPEGKRRALAASQKADVKYKISQARKVVAGSATLAAAAGASPIPFSDAAILAPIQIGMMAGITSVFGLELSKATLTTLTGSALGVTGATLIGRTIAVNLLKMIPGAGTAVGGAISAATASTLTVALGEAYIAVLANFFTENPEATPVIEDIVDRLKEKMRS
ncbi:50S ribosome-binding GTPase [Duganella sp. LX20W]|uniref:50S ribosome-binding GTPase n=1 Tax=Rugamonas brunnea TaxID=2758569 RepID=A0A7W2EX51_9BURK|nr:DUF697 domain-containing protein [Rugamonas brunnea]MBA5640249.1 50S ribosome-binding GTPase [Rugamonas brunnea]